ncbi:MAG: hypothetical protein EOP09_10330 [Proteobacteria bacterium]|nr:MAG: hypothetical protein EOP09_10330 [Pseudomonadota bacterium]
MALFDERDFEAVMTELSSVVRDVPDNLVAQRLFAESALMLGRTTESLGAYKMLLYFNNQDKDAERMVRELEVQAYDQGAMVLRTDPAPQKVNHTIKAASEAIDSDERVIKQKKFKQVEVLQSALVVLERYRAGLR